MSPVRDWRKIYMDSLRNLGSVYIIWVAFFLLFFLDFCGLNDCSMGVMVLIQLFIHFRYTQFRYICFL